MRARPHACTRGTRAQRRDETWSGREVFARLACRGRDAGWPESWGLAPGTGDWGLAIGTGAGAGDRRPGRGAGDRGPGLGLRPIPAWGLGQ